MPFKIEQDESACSAAEPWAVKNADTGRVMGCHVSKEKAQKQLAALNANVPDASAASLADRRDVELPRENLIRAIYEAEDVSLLEFRDGEDAPPVMAGHFAVYDNWTEINSLWEGHFMERFAPGSFKKTIRENLSRMRVLFQHGHDPQLGDKPLGAIETLRDTTVGPYYEVPLLRNEDGTVVDYIRSLIPGLKAGLYGASMRFKVMKEEFVQKPKRSRDNPDALPERTVTEAKVMEFGPVTFPAYAEATAGMRSLTDDFLLGSLRGSDPQKLAELLKRNGAVALSTEPESSETTTPEPESRTTPSEKRFKSREEYLEWIGRI
jgi:HK97 family phage prohead protease